MSFGYIKLRMRSRPEPCQFECTHPGSGAALTNHTGSLATYSVAWSHGIGPACLHDHTGVRARGHTARGRTGTPPRPELTGAGQKSIQSRWCDGDSPSVGRRLTENDDAERPIAPVTLSSASGRRVQIRTASIAASAAALRPSRSALRTGAHSCVHGKPGFVRSTTLLGSGDTGECPLSRTWIVMSRQFLPHALNGEILTIVTVSL